jgi:hypothetical protein
MEFWIEIESPGKKEKVGPVGGIGGLFGAEKAQSPNQIVEGYFLWLRDEADEAGVEKWRVACRRHLVAATSSGLKITNLLGEASTSELREDRQSSSSAFSQSRQVWKGKKPNATGSFSTSSIATPLPTDREVCLKETRELGSRPDEWMTLGASTVGLLGSPSRGPLLAASALVPGRADEPEERHTFKVMCKAVTKKDKEANNESPPK